MKYLPKIYILICLYLIGGNSIAQDQNNLVAIFLPNYVISETGLEYEEFHDPNRTINILIIDVPRSFMKIDPTDYYIDKIIIEYSIWNIDTIIYKDNNDSIIIKKDFIYITQPDSRPILMFTDSKSQESEFYLTLTFCQNNKGSKYRIQLENYTSKKLKYVMYYNEDCDKNRSSEKIVRHGLIKLKKKK